MLVWPAETIVMANLGASNTMIYSVISALERIEVTCAGTAGQLTRATGFSELKARELDVADARAQPVN